MGIAPKPYGTRRKRSKLGAASVTTGSSAMLSGLWAGPSPKGPRKKRLFTGAVAHMRRAGDLVDCSWKLILLSALELADNNPEAAADLLEGDLAIWEEVEASGSPRELAAAWCVLADTRLFEGRFVEAAVWLRRALISTVAWAGRAVGDMPNVICCVARLGNPGDAARLTGAFNTMLSWHVPWSTPTRRRTPLPTCTSCAERGCSRLSWTSGSSWG